jgi:hypothetical protein
VTQFLLGAAIGATVFAAIGHLRTPSELDTLKLAAARYAAEIGSEPAWLLERSSSSLTIAVALGDYPTVLFFGYPDNLVECERLVALYARQTSMTEALCETRE